jgi:hypothetical protein
MRFDAITSVPMTDTASHARRWWTLKEAAAHIEMHPLTLYRHAKKAVRKYARNQKGMPVIRHNGHHYRFPIEEFKAWADHPTD